MGIEELITSGFSNSQKKYKEWGNSMKQSIFIFIIIMTLAITNFSTSQASQSKNMSLELSFATKTPQPNYPICSSVAVGKSTTCKVKKAYCSYQSKVKGKPTFCNDAPYPRHNFTYVVWGKDLSTLSGHCIIVTGKVVTYKGKPEISSQTNSSFKGYCD
jgi:hypothetical protein